MFMVILVMFFYVFIFVLPFFVIGLLLKDTVIREYNKAKEEERIIRNARKDSQKTKQKPAKEVDACEGSVIRDELLENWPEEEETKEEVKEKDNQGIEGIFEGLSEGEILVVASEIFQPRYY